MCDVTSAKSAIISVSDKVGSLKEVCELFEKHGFNMTSIQSRPSPSSSQGYDFFIDFETTKKDDEVNALVKELEGKTSSVTILTKGQTKSEVSLSTSASGVRTKEIPWFPRKLKDLDGFAEKTMEFGSELDADHPGFQDPEYRKRRCDIVAKAKTYRSGQPLPRVEYTPQEIETWGIVYNKLRSLYPTHACREQNHIFPLLEQNCGYSPNNIPQLEDISNFLQECTGWRLRPVMGLLSSRDFLNGLAFRVFHSTQYIRHHSKPLYTPEPDVCHELLGHVPLFADPAFADFSQEIGLASLGASDEDIAKLATCYWFTVEFGLCRQDGQVKAFGAGILSSFGELEYSMSSEPELRPFDPFQACEQEYPITKYQPVYFVAESFERAKAQMRQFAESLDRPFTVHYNPFTQTVEVLDTKEKLVSLANTLRSDISLLVSGIRNLP
ncbi:phenylalanine hydroxylase [Acanthamoeba castellanii str. Neff]|jgi:phenylalanine-4-hydroxylase|uniref:phenylalanine 4-monooxygenase n=1 Tax=Acanthamoeba castellanii (strain ATCC 30010 / Neff) TaxID=1257118 RepID=L8GPS8_ACACF|nr:phenylalanine hydroxylase [Acanthamoeba castellanii str. Neff]ELR14932.1 phenylalanine hydroxylase [Acanthamoeba castellanii str. Neff]